MSNIVNISGKEQFENEVLQSDLPVLVDFWAPWCMPCRMMGPVLDELSDHYEGKLKIVKVDTTDQPNEELAYKYQIQSIPNMKLFKNGDVVEDYIGFRPKEVFVSDLDNVLG